MKYQKLDTKFLEKFWRLLDEKSRFTSKLYKDHSCPKEVFVQRTLKKWFVGKYIAFIEHQKFDDDGIIKFPVKVYSCIGRISYYLGHGEEVAISMSNAADVTKLGIFGGMKLNKYTSQEFEFAEIDRKEYLAVKSIFADDREDKEYTVNGYNNGTLEKSEIKVTGKSRREAIEDYKGELWIGK